MYGGVSINPMFWPARRREAYNVGRHLQGTTRCSRAACFEFLVPARGPWDGRFETRLRLASLEGWRRDAHRPRHGADRHERAIAGRMIEQIAKTLFANVAAER
jgi:arginine deiminase